ncbi:LOW QUALITY PROTEIN: hypothetical protein PHMEG_00012354 [Phytophthora megakarya]|uniref:Uncharacterized protein n=1 Tax=Phytophthora megakarya TaxID=4795 RepID=A0A225W9E5_9STRA|nr:LOW QUALITY PROTEIN: hypothetical protein PHMEG_00012354 [Phytophthora megakarya]
MNTFRKFDGKWIRRNPDDFMGAEVRLAKGLSCGDAQVALLNLTMEKVEKLDDAGHSKLNGEDGTRDALSNKFKPINSQLLESIAKLLANKLLRDSSLPDYKKTTMISVVIFEWLVSQIRLLDKPFSWEMPLAEVPDISEMKEVLKGPDETMRILVGQGILFLRTLGSGIVKTNRKSVFRYEFSSCGDFVIISKIREWYDEVLQKQILPQLKEELKGLNML